MRKWFVFGIVCLGMFLLAGQVLAATSWYFPEGSTEGKDFWMVVTNPHTSTTAEITFTFYTDTGTQTYDATVTAGKRYTLYVNGISGMDEKPISTKVVCTNGLNIYAERALYFPKGDPDNWTWGHAARGISGLEGCHREISQPQTTISESGSYKLSGNITSTTENVNVITITASNVTLDLNGFAVNGPGSGTTGYGIFVQNGTEFIRNVTVKNGAVNSCMNGGVYMDRVTNGLIRDVKFYDNGDYGAYISDLSYGCVVENCQFNSNGSDSTDAGIWIGYHTVVRNNVLYDNYIAIYVRWNINRIEGNHCTASTSGNDIVFSSLATKNLCINNSYHQGESIPGANTVQVDKQLDADL